ncbi:hypothetical protein [Desulfovibrio sp. ZJ369]|uniref:hypothetical protein n=1 Tax=Desulfovibrio sp. ZJ369 TaxID=2709793 RepID=UPI0013EBAB98|nr:hypothetical protein [Desulfovibrio sp. ZJ369]
MDREQLQQRLLPRLIEAEAVHKSGRSPEELALLAEIFADDLDGENPEAIERAFALHRRESSRFPTPAHILALLPRCRQPVQSLPPLPMECSGRKAPGLGRLVSRALRGEAAARNAMEKLIRQTRAGVRQ